MIDESLYEVDISGDVDANLQLPIAVKFLFTPSRYKVPYGGRGSAKSWSVAKVLVLLACATYLRIFCGREYQNSLQDSVHKLLSDQIEIMGLGAHFRITQNSISNPYTGSEFLFDGLHNNTTKIKSTEGINIAWIEEAEKVTKASWETLIPTIRTPWILPFEFWPPDTTFTEEEEDLGGRLVGSEIWVTFNPSEETDNTYQRFIVNPPPDAIVKLINYRDNPWFPLELLKEMEYMKRVDYEDYLHIWEGQCTKKSAAQVLRGKWRSESFEAGVDWDGPYYGTDWGFSVDPSTCTRSWIHNNRLWIDYESYGVGVENDDLPLLLDKVPQSSLYVNRADSSRPETISHCRRHGHPRMTAAEKWPGSVEDGINYLRGTFEEIIIHPRCTATLQEARLWSYKVDKNSGDVLPTLEDKNNHCWDSIRYALAPLIKNKVVFVKNWWRIWVDENLKKLEARLTLKMITITTDEVSDGGAELGAVMQYWGIEGYSGLYLLSERATWGTLPDLIEQAQQFWADHQKGFIVPTELWVDAKSMGQSMIRQLRQRELPAREWNPDDKIVIDPTVRAKQTSVHVSAGRVFVPTGSPVMTEVEGLATNAMTLAVIIWQQRGGGRGPIPQPF